MSFEPVIYFFRYFRHASGEMYIISRALAQFISINRWKSRFINAFLKMSRIFYCCCSGWKGCWFPCAIYVNSGTFCYLLCTGMFYVHMPTMMFPLAHGLLASMSSTLMKENYVARLHGLQVSLITRINFCSKY